MSDATNNKSFGSGLKSINGVCKRIDYIIDNIYIFFYQSDLRIEALAGYENVTQ